MTFEDIKNASSSFHGYYEFMLFLNFQDWLSMKNWIIDSSYDEQIEFKNLPKQYLIKNDFVSFKIDNIVFYATRDLLLDKSFICPIKMLNQ